MSMEYFTNRKVLQDRQLPAYKRLVTYGRRFRQLRGARTLEDIAAEMGIKKGRGSSVSNIEQRRTYPPRLATIKKHAAALGCEPWQLLQGVPSQAAWPVLPEKSRLLYVETARRILALQADSPILAPAIETLPKGRRKDRRTKRA
jgi:transcriptional regulator with XRE-family HTH domain